ncbi:rhodanese-like domain-containing protein [Terrabacter sp. C0L_2]|uniref:rhodanese-like domain-containing protein n=1 Tax=Terrabacter sp. C0L_2 TaxID=3108389 RepID=UPI002ED27FCB|nr:rhodanese-like domain-containing protein [Terrabacter sp. C0L_2]
MLDATAVEEWLQQPDAPTLIDVRTPGEFAGSHIPGSYNVPLDLLKEHRKELSRELQDHFVLVCRSGARAEQAKESLASVGAALPTLHVLDGGLAAWERDDRQVVRAQPRWELERQVRLVAGSIVLAAVLLSVLVPGAKWVAAAIGAGLTLAAISNSCLMGMMLAKLPYNRRTSPSIDEVLAALRP